MVFSGDSDSTQDPMEAIQDQMRDAMQKVTQSVGANPGFILSPSAAQSLIELSFDSLMDKYGLHCQLRIIKSVDGSGLINIYFCQPPSDSVRHQIIEAVRKYDFFNDSYWSSDVIVRIIFPIHLLIEDAVTHLAEFLSSHGYTVSFVRLSEQSKGEFVAGSVEDEPPAKRLAFDLEDMA